MKPVEDETLHGLESAVSPSVQAIKAYLAYQGENSQYRDKAKVAVGIISAFARIRSSETNRMQVELIALRVADDAPNRLNGAK